MKYRIDCICDLNKSSLTNKDRLNDILYLDTSSITMNRISELQTIKIIDAPSRAKRKVKDKTIIYSTVRPNLKHFGILTCPKENMVVSTGFTTIDVKKEFRNEISAEYLYYLLTNQSITDYLATKAESAVSSYPSINPSDIGELTFSFPEIKIQEAVVNSISPIDQKIALNTRMNAELEAMAKQLYDYWFVQFDFPDENGNPYKSSGGKMVYNSTLKREIPAGWNASNICIVSQILSGGTPSKAVKQYWENGNIPFFGPTDYEGYVFQMRTADHITERGLNNCASSLFEEGDIIITARGSIGKLVIVGVPMAMNQSCYALRPKNNQYEYLFFLTKQLIEYLKIKGNGSVFKSIIASDIEDSIMCIATDNVIYAYCEKVSPLFLLMKKNTEEIINLTHLRDSLLPMLMNGQVTVE